MANEVKIVLTAVDKASAVLNKAGDNAKKQGMNWKAAFTAVGAGATVAFAAVSKVVGDAVKEFTSYAEQVRTMSAATGMSNEETSKMIQLFDDANVEIGLFTAAARKMVQQGIQPSVENIANLADEYNSLQDPVARSKLLLDNFGRSGLQMGKLMAMGGDAIRAAGEDAEKFGLVLDDKAIKSAEEFRIALDNLSDAGQGLKLTLGQAVVPALTKVVSGFNTYIARATEFERISKQLLMLYQAEKIGIEEYQGAVADAAETQIYSADVIRMVEAEIAKLGNTTDDYGTRLRNTTEAQEDLTISQERAIEAMTNLNQLIGGQLGPEMIGFRDKTKELKDEAIRLQGEIDILESKKWLSRSQKEELEGLKGDLKEVEGNITDTADAHDKATKRILFNILTQRAEMGGLSEAEATALNNIALQWGLVDTATYMAIQKADQFFSDIEAGAEKSKQDINNLDRAMRGLPSTHTFSVYWNIYQKIYEDLEWRERHQQHGGPVTGGIPYIVGEAGPELFVPHTSGKIIPNNQLTGGGGGKGGGISIGEINVFASSGMDEETIARMVIARLSAAARHSGYAGLDYAG